VNGERAKRERDGDGSIDLLAFGALVQAVVEVASNDAAPESGAVEVGVTYGIPHLREQDVCDGAFCDGDRGWFSFAREVEQNDDPHRPRAPLMSSD
jgi:hypothetical protein